MAIIKSRELSKMNEREIVEKLRGLKLELIKANVTANKTGKIKIREIKKTIARLLTLSAKRPQTK